jgi:hypothetical protein
MIVNRLLGQFGLGPSPDGRDIETSADHVAPLTDSRE